MVSNGKDVGFRHLIKRKESVRKSIFESHFSAITHNHQQKRGVRILVAILTRFRLPNRDISWTGSQYNFGTTEREKS
jgi:hypothetical protein